MLRRRSERRWTARVVLVATGAESATCTLQCNGVDPAKLVQVVHRAGHVVTERPTHGVEALRIVQFENSDTSLGVDLETNKCAEVGSSLLTTTLQLRFQYRHSQLLRHRLSHSDSHDYLANVCPALQQAQRRLHRLLFERKALE